MELWGLRGFEREFAAHGDAEAVARPPREGDVHHAQHEVHASQRAVFLPGGARAITVAGEPGNMGAGFFLGRIVKADPNDLARGDKLGREADDRSPEVPAVVVERDTRGTHKSGKRV